MTEAPDFVPSARVRMAWGGREVLPPGLGISQELAVTDG
jgi:hypothetical protein